jgi:hypothetical protein
VDPVPAPQEVDAGNDCMSASAHGCSQRRSRCLGCENAADWLSSSSGRMAQSDYSRQGHQARTSALETA